MKLKFSFKDFYKFCVYNEIDCITFECRQFRKPRCTYVCHVGVFNGSRNINRNFIGPLKVVEHWMRDANAAKWWKKPIESLLIVLGIALKPWHIAFWYGRPLGRWHWGDGPRPWWVRFGDGGGYMKVEDGFVEFEYEKTH